jgi:hypothetical protein
MTAAGWSDQPSPAEGVRSKIRREWGVPADAIVFGLVGSLVWNRRRRYCYGLELVRAAQLINRPEVHVVVAGGGSGLPELQSAAGAELGSRILLLGAVPSEKVIDILSAMDVGSLPQSVDGVGAFRYTTKISEYLASRLPIVTGELPMAYDLGDESWLWRLPGSMPWSDQYILALSRLMSSLTPEELAKARAAIPSQPCAFNRSRQIRAATAFCSDLLKGVMK